MFTNRYCVYTQFGIRMDIYASGAEFYVSPLLSGQLGRTKLDKVCFFKRITPRTKSDGVDLQTSGEQYGVKTIAHTWNRNVISAKEEINSYCPISEKRDTYQLYPLAQKIASH